MTTAVTSPIVATVVPQHREEKIHKEGSAMTAALVLVTFAALLAIDYFRRRRAAAQTDGDGYSGCWS